MNNYELEIESIQMSLYLQSIMQLFSKKNSESIVKVILFSFVIKHGYVASSNGFTTKRSLYLQNFLNFIRINISKFMIDSKYILKTIDLLVKQDVLTLSENILTINKCQNIEEGNCILDYKILEVLEEMDFISDKNVISEVFSYV